MQLSLDLPKYKWKEILKYLTPHRHESENVSMLCTAIEMAKDGETLNQKIYTLLVSNGLPLINYLQQEAYKNVKEVLVY